VFAFRGRISLERLFGWAAGVIVAVFIVLGLLGSLLLPYLVWDSLVYSEWSRLIADAGALHFHFSPIGAYHLQRPLFYVLQGWLWDLTGFSERTGRLLSLAFFVLLVVAVARLAARRSSLDGQVATLILLSVAAVSLYLSVGLTDIPVAAMVALVGLAVTSRIRHRWVLIGLAAVGAGLTKTAAYPAVLGLLIAVLLVGERGMRPLAKRAITLGLPIVLGTAVALVYDETQSRYLGMSLSAFLRTGTGGYYSTLSDQVRWHVFAQFAWLGGGAMILLLLYGLLYGVARTSGLEHRASAAIAVGVSVPVSLLGPAATSQRGPVHSVWTAAIFVSLTAMLLFGLTRAASQEAASRGQIAFVTIWALPTTLAWLVEAPYDTRLLAPAWPPLVVLIAWSLTPALRSAIRERSYLAAYGAAALAALAIGNLWDANGMTFGEWHALAQQPWSTIVNEDKVRAFLTPEFEETLPVINRLLGDHGRLFASDGRYRFYFPGRSTGDYPRSCQSLMGYDAFVLDLSPSAVSYMRDYVHSSPEPSYWAACNTPHLDVVLQTPDHVVFAVKP
jgi:hypothetical protein